MRINGWFLVHGMLLSALVLGGCGGGGGGGGGESSPGGGGNAVPDSRPVATEQPSAPFVVTADLSYTVEKLATPGGDCYAVALNDAGEVTGNCRNVGGGTDAWAWRDGRMELIAQSAQAAAIGNEGEVVGWLEGSNGTDAFYHDRYLYPLVFPEGTAKALAVNDQGQIAGRLTMTNQKAVPQQSGLSVTTEKAFLQQAGLTDTIAPEVNGYAIALNNAGQIVIKEVLDDRFHALLWDNGQMTDLGTLGGANTQVRDINNQGQIVGWSDTGDGRYHAFLWENGRMIDLAGSPAEYSAAVAINDHGQILIKTASPFGDRFSLWQEGTLTDLGYFGASYAEALALNNNGQVAGWLMSENGYRAFLATPVSN